MRTRNSNAYNEVHGNTMRIYDWIAPAGTIPSDVPVGVEAALGIHIIQNAPDEPVDGYINTSLRPDGSLYVSVQLYDTACLAVGCRFKHPLTPFRVSPEHTHPQLTAMVAAVGEHQTHKLNRGNARALMLQLGFTVKDAPLQEDD